MLAELVDDPARLEQVRTAWDELALDRASPFSGPGWLLAWWRHAAPPAARLRAVLALENRELVGIAPFFAGPDSRGIESYRLLASGTSAGVEPLVRPGREDEFAELIAAELERDGARLVRFVGIPAGTRWPQRLADAWPGRPPWLHVEVSMPAPYVSLDGVGYDEWLSSLSPKFQKNIRRLARRLEEQGAGYRLAGDELERDIAAFADLHHSRWAGRGGSGVLDERVEQMLLAVAPELVPEGRLRLWSLDIEGRTIGSELFVACGGVVSSWLGGFDERWAAQEPSKHLILREIRHAFERGERRVDLGPGDQEFKLRFARAAETLEWAVLVPRGPGHARTRLRLAPRRLRRALGGRLGPERKRMLKRLLRVEPRT